MTQSHYKQLSSRWRAKHQDLQRKLWSKHKESLDWLSNNYRQLVSGSLGGLMLLTGQISGSLPSLPAAKVQAPIVQKTDNKVFLISDLAHVLPKDVRPLSSEEEQNVSDILSRTYGIKVMPELDGKRLNRNYGLIGAEQHLTRYPGDNLASHFDSDEDTKLYWQQGMAPGLGAWSYFAPSKEN